MVAPPTEEQTLLRGGSRVRIVGLTGHLLAAGAWAEDEEEEHEDEHEEEENDLGWERRAPWTELSEGTKKYDFDAVRNFPKWLAAAGSEIVPRS
jgi:hypothetical protein